MSIMEVFRKAVDADVEAGSHLIDMVVYDLMADLVELNKDDIAAVYGMWALDRVQVAKRTLARSYVSSVSKGSYPSDDTHMAAQWMAGIERFVVAAARGEISKATNESWSIEGRTVNRMISRDASGRFTRGINQNASREIGVTETNVMSPALKQTINNEQNGFTRGNDESRARHQGQYEEAVRYANELKGALGSNKGSADAMFILQSPNGDIRYVHAPMKDVNSLQSGGVNIRDLRADDNILGVEVVPKQGATAGEAAKIATFNLLGGAGGSALAQLANTDPKLRSALADSLKMPNAASDQSGLSRLFGLLGAGGAVISGIPGAEKVGQMTALVGSMGPQAEEVLGPYVKRSAYRYRGTETTPGVELRNPLLFFVSPEQVASAVRPFKDSSNESKNMHLIADVASGVLAETIPQDPIIARLSEESGQVLPSQGVIYDSKGKLVSQSVGFTDDHYLPFDLGNLGRLRGGQYVRTRQQGGLTGEDIYTTVMSGARQAQVVSGSGVFNIEMSSDFRGARAMSDKARSMYTNYLKILDAVEQTGLYLEDISPDAKSKLYDEARSELGSGATQKEISDVASAKIEQARIASETVTDSDRAKATLGALEDIGYNGLAQFNDASDATEQLDAYNTKAAALGGIDRRKFADNYEDRIAELRATKSNKLRLNAQGYSVALSTLQQQFPYFITNVGYRRLDAMPTDRRQNLGRTREYAVDRGYAQPGSLRAQNIETGYYNPGQIEPGAKPQRNSPTTAASAPQSSDTPQVSAPASAGAPSTVAIAPAASTGVQSRINTDQTLAPTLRKTIEALFAGVSSLGSAERQMASGGLNKLSFANISETDKVAQVGWLLSQEDPAMVTSTLSGPLGARAAEALAEQDAVKAFLGSAIASSIDYGDVDDFFNTRSIGDAKSLDAAAEWVSTQGNKIADLSAMTQGLAATPTTSADIANHRGLMPMQMPGIGLISDKEGFTQFASKPENASLMLNARAIAFDRDGNHQPISVISQVANDRLDAIAQIATAQVGYRGMVMNNPGKKWSDNDVRSLVESDVWTKATGNNEMPSLATFVNYNNSGTEANLVQQAWSLAVTGRIIESMDGGDVYPKAGSRLMEPIGKASKQRVLVNVTGQPIRRTLIKRK